MEDVKIGLEVHTTISDTKTKLFCKCPNTFGRNPNTNVCPICLGMPGSKPVVNKSAIDSAIKVAIALNCKIKREMYFSRKTYFYPDLAKNFQISQYDMPLAENGYLDIGKKKINIKRVHIEEDPGRIVHVGGGITDAKYILVDYNRSGIPLCEIVTQPDFNSPQEVRVFLNKLSSILEYLGVYDSSREAAMRVDANVSIRAGERVEIKNITGFKDVERALTYEIIRQRNVLKMGKRIWQETRAWDPVANITKSLRTKEFEEDYGYIVEADLPVIEIDKKWILEIKKRLPELPDEKLKRYSKIIKRELAESIISDKELSEIFDEVIKVINPKLAAVWFGNVLKKILNYNNMRMKDTEIKPEHMISFLRSIESNKISPRMAEMILREMVKKPKEVRKIDKVLIIRDKNKIKAFVVMALEKNPKAVLDYKAGKKEAFEFLVGQALKESRGRAEPKLIREVLKKAI